MTPAIYFALGIGFCAFVWLYIDRAHAALQSEHDDETLPYTEEGGWGSEDEQEAQAYAPEDDVHEYSRDVFPVEPR